MYEIYIGLCNFGASLCLWMATLHASSQIFCKLYSHLMHCSSEFFDTTPKGRILDRCSNDINTIDLVLPMTIRMFMSTAFQVIKKKTTKIYRLILNLEKKKIFFLFLFRIS